MTDPETGARAFAGPEGRGVVGWFDDHLVHSIEAVDDDDQWSIRVDGRFTQEFRELVAREGAFGEQTVPQDDDGGMGLRGVLLAQTEGPTFLQRENEEEEEEEEDEEEEEEEDVDSEGEGEAVGDKY